MSILQCYNLQLKCCRTFLTCPKAMNYVPKKHRLLNIFKKKISYSATYCMPALSPHRPVATLSVLSVCLSVCFFSVCLPTLVHCVGPPSQASQQYRPTLHHHRHNIELPSRISHLTDCSFIQWTLYFNCCWL